MVVLPILENSSLVVAAQPSPNLKKRSTALSTTQLKKHAETFDDYQIMLVQRLRNTTSNPL